jgi:CubicO group peptidase (beta-lactamase class C family)
MMQIREIASMTVAGAAVAAILILWHFEPSSLASAANPSTALMKGDPAAAGFSPERLARLDPVMQQAIDQGTISGMVTVVARHGRIVQEKAYGMADRENKAPMRTDSMFRLASTTKIVTTVAAMQLLEEGKLLVNDPVSKFIPGFAKTTVAQLVPGSSTKYTVVPAKRQITIHDVLTKTTGIAYPIGPTLELFEAQGFHQWYFADKNVPMCTMMEKLPQLPFHAQPGERWMNGYTADILGCIIEKISGTSLDQFMRTRIFDPLKMTDTYFFVPKEKASRLTVVYGATPDGKIKRADGRWTEGQGDYVDGPRVAFSGGAGLVTTVNDYARFLQMLLNGGELDGARLISPKTVELITANHLGNLFKNGKMGFGFNVEVNIPTGDADRLGSLGDYGWAGAYFPRFLVDPSEQMFAIFFAQLTPYGGASDLHDKFTNGVYQALLAPSKHQQTN